MAEMLLSLAGVALFVLVLGGVAGLARQGGLASSKDADLINRLRS